MPKKIKFYSLWFLLIIIGIFILQVLIPGFTESLVLNEKAISEYQIWRFVSAIFLHGSIIHLTYNLFALFFFGFALEKLIGSRKFLLLFFASGIIANIISVNFYPSSLGASGSIMGIIGCLTIIKPLMMVWAFGLILPMFIASGLWIAGDILRSLGAFGETNIGSIAHLSGVGIGFLFGILLRSFRKNKPKINKIKISEPDMRGWEQRYVLRN